MTEGDQVFLAALLCVAVIACMWLAAMWTDAREDRNEYRKLLGRREDELRKARDAALRYKTEHNETCIYEPIVDSKERRRLAQEVSNLKAQLSLMTISRNRWQAAAFRGNCAYADNVQSVRTRQDAMHLKECHVCQAKENRNP